MDTRRDRAFDGVIRHIDVLAGGTRQAGDGTVLDDAADSADGFKIARRSDGEARFHDVYTQLFQRQRQFDLFLENHGAAGRLFAVAQGRVKYLYLFHSFSSLSRNTAPLSADDTHLA